MATRYNQTRALLQQLWPGGRYCRAWRLPDLARPKQRRLPGRVLRGDVCQQFIAPQLPVQLFPGHVDGRAPRDRRGGAAAGLRAGSRPDAVRAALEGYALDLASRASTIPTATASADLRRPGRSGLWHGPRSGRPLAPTAEPPPCFTVSATADGPVWCYRSAAQLRPDGEDPIELTAYDFGTVLTFTADPDPGNVFTGWAATWAATRRRNRCASRAIWP